MLNKLPPNWHLKKVDDVANIYLGLTYTPTYTESGIPFLSVKDLNDTYLDFAKSKFISHEEYKNATENAKPKKGDIIFGRVGTLGNPLIIETDIEFCIFVSLGFFRIRDNSCEPNFLASWMKSPLFHKQVDNIVAGGAQKNLNTGWLKNFVIPLPPLPEQKAIARVLSTADAAINTTEKLIAQKELRKKWLMQQLLTGKKRLKGFGGEWKEMKLGDFIVESRIPSYENDVNRRITVKLNLKGIEKRDVRGSEAEDATYFFVRKRGQFIYGKQNLHKGAFGIIPEELDGFESSQDIPAFDFLEGVNPNYFMFFMSQEGFYQSLEKISTGTGSKRIHPENLFKVKVKFPSYEEQTAIDQVLQSADKEISLLKAKAEKLREQKKGLMQQLLTGKIRLKL